MGIFIFLATSSESRHFLFYTFWLAGISCFIGSLLTFVTASPDDRLLSTVSFHGIFALVGYVCIVAAGILAHGQERAVLYARVMEERQYRAASEITQLAASNSSLLELLNFALDKVVNMLGLSGGAIHVFHRARENLVLGSYMGLSARLARRLETIEFGDTAIGRTAKNKRLLIIRDLRLSQDYELFGGKQEGFSYMALVPIVSEGENWGVISLFGKGSYQPGSLQVDLLEQFGEQLGAALVLGRQVRNMQTARENLAYLVKALGQELSDTALTKSGLGAARAIAWMVTRFFGGDRFDICSMASGNWTCVYSSEPEVEGRVLQAGYDFVAGPLAGNIESNQPAPFAEFADEKSYVYTSLFVGKEWLFIRLEGKRRKAADFGLLSDSFKIIHGLFSKMAYQVSSKAKETSRSQIAREEKSGNLSVMVGDLDRLMRQYSDIGERPEMRDLFLWLESIRRTARDYAKPQPSRSLSAPSRPEKTLGIGDIIDRAIEKVAYQQGNGFKFDYHRQGEIPAPSIPPDQFEKSILEFLTAALFNAGAAGSLKLETRNENRSLIFELQGNRLAEPPRPADRPEWLRRINGRLEARRVENDQGQTHDTWRLYIPLESGAEESGSPNEPLKILAIDSQDIIRDLLTSMLDSLGHDSKVVGTADEAGLLFRDAANSGQPYAIIIADHSLEKTSGLQLARDFKAQNPNLLFILLSGWGLALDPDEAARMGVDFVLDKPFRLEQLAEAIRTVRNTAA